MAIAIPVPQISISPAPPQESFDEPFSPFSWANPDADDSFRPKHLTPPPVTAKFVRQLSPLRPADAPGKVQGKGLEPERFEALLKASRERNAVVGVKRTDLRKEVALKAHKSKQVERRALFLSKVAAPPSPTATTLPKTPPESPAIFHYTLPSPGLVSPLALFDSLNSDKSGSGPLSYPREPWVEQVDFRMPSPPKNSATPPARATVHEPKPPKSLPSLDQISARLQSQGHSTILFSESAPRSNRLPAFLTQAHAPVATERPTLSVGRLQLPINSKRASLPVQSSAPLPKSPNLSVDPVIQVTTIRVPRTRRMSSLDLSESNLLALNSREKTAKDMLSTLRRRMVPIEEEPPVDDRKWRRHSAPADLSPGKPRSGFEHPVLLLPGGF